MSEFNIAILRATPAGVATGVAADCHRMKEPVMRAMAGCFGSTSTKKTTAWMKSIESLFYKLEEKILAFLDRGKTADGEQSRFFQFISRDND